MIFGLNFKEENTMANQFLLNSAYRYAWYNSQDPSTKTGAIIIQESEELANIVYTPVAYGTNTLKEGIQEQFSPKELEKKLKDSQWKRNAMEYAEVSSIKAAHSIGYDTIGSTMVMPWIPCEGCGKEIVKAGITKLIAHDGFINKTPQDWKESTLRGVELLLDNNVEIVTYSGKIGSCYGQFRGEVWKP